MEWGSWTAMKLSVDVPQRVKDQLERRAKRAGLTPADYVGKLVQQSLADEIPAFSEQFLSLPGSWEDERTTEEIVRDIEESRITGQRPELR